MTEVIDAALAMAGRPCELCIGPVKYLEKFEDWYKGTSLLADALGIKQDEKTLRLMLLWGRRGKNLEKQSEILGSFRRVETKTLWLQPSTKSQYSLANMLIPPWQCIS